MNGRKRTVQIKFRVTEAERDLILEKMKLIPTRNIAKRVNSTGSVYQEAIEEIKGVLAEIWRLQRLSLLKER